ncbi:hypothetical protein D3260_07210 [Salinisphaera sp. Q1T1-3]|nr:hypothetical protein D3260_07210 [Salinisphaera sp. Q1T1-3]
MPARRAFIETRHDPTARAGHRTRVRDLKLSQALSTRSARVGLLPKIMIRQGAQGAISGATRRDGGHFLRNPALSFATPE